MTAILNGVRILEVADHTFVPAASAALSDLGADVIKIEHIERGDAIRGLASTGMMAIAGGVHALLEHSNRGKRSLGLDLTTPEGLEVLYRIAETADVFLTNKLPSVRTKLGIELGQLRARNPKIIYVCGTGQGRARTRCRQGFVRFARVLGPQWDRPGVDAPGVRPGAHASRPRLR